MDLNHFSNACVDGSYRYVCIMVTIPRFVSNRKYAFFDTGEAKSFTFGIWLLGSDLIGIVGIRKKLKK